MKKVLPLAALMIAAGSAALEAATVKIWGDDLTLMNQVRNFYSGGGHTATNITTLDATSVAGADLLWVVWPGQNLTANEISALQGHLAGGLRLAMMGENSNAAFGENLRISAAIGQLGGSMSIGFTTLDSGFHDATGAQLANHPLTVGVSTFNYAAYAPLNISGTAQAVMFGSDLTSVMVAEQAAGGGCVVLMAEGNGLTNIANTGSNDNAVFFNNLLGSCGSAGGSEMPEPGTFGTLAAAAAMAVLARRRSARRTALTPGQASAPTTPASAKPR